MSNENETESILVFTYDPNETKPFGNTRGIKDALEHAGTVISEVSISTLQKNMEQFLIALDVVMSKSSRKVGGLSLDEIEIHSQIDSQGNVGISGIGIEAATRGSIKLVFRKRDDVV